MNDLLLNLGMEYNISGSAWTERNGVTRRHEIYIYICLRKLHAYKTIWGKQIEGYLWTT